MKVHKNCTHCTNKKDLKQKHTTWDDKGDSSRHKSTYKSNPTHKKIYHIFTNQSFNLPQKNPFIFHKTKSIKLSTKEYTYCTFYSYII